MGKIKCINPKNYNLVRDEEYDILGETGEMYVVQNSKGKQHKYSKELFAPVFTDTTESIINSINASNNGILYTYRENEVNINTWLSGGYSRLDISCGVTQISGVNDVMWLIGDHLSNQQNFPEEIDVEAIKKAMFIQCLQHKISNNIYGIFLLSTNVTGNENFDIINDSILECGYNVNFTDAYNPSSENTIRLWAVQKLQPRTDDEEE